MSKNAMKVTSKPLRARNLVLRSERSRKRAEAKVRKDIYDSLSTEQKLAKLDAGGFVAAKQRAKLALPGLIAKAQEERAKLPGAEPEFKKGAKAERQRRKDKKAAKTAQPKGP